MNNDNSMTRSGTRRSQRGGALVELSMLSPLLAIMLVGVVDLGRLFYTGIAVSHAARAGAQFGIMSTTTTPTTADTPTTSNTYGIVAAALNDLSDVQGVYVKVEQYCACANGAIVSCDTKCSQTEGGPRRYVRVVAQKYVRLIIPYPGFPHSLRIQREAVMRAR